MSEKIIVLHPENQPEVDIYPIIKEGSIPNSVIDNQKIKSRTIINSNIALNTLKYEVLHSTLKQLIDSKITQANMENYLTSYYYNVEETQQYVGSEINTLHQTIQNEFYSNTTIDNMLMEKTDLSLFRQYLPSTYLDLTKQENNQTSKLNIHANGSIFLMNSGNKTNSGNYYLPNSIVKTEDAPNGYYVLSTTNDDYQSLYNLGAYDKIVTNDDGTYTITRQTGYLKLDGNEHKFKYKMGSTTNAEYAYEGAINYISRPSSSSIIASIISNTLKTLSADDLYTQNTYGIAVDTRGVIIVGLTTAIDTLDKANAYLVQNPISIQYKLATATTEKVEKNHYATYNQDFILDHNKREAEKSANLLDYSKIVNNYTLTSDGQLLPYNGYYVTDFIRVEPNKTYTMSNSHDGTLYFYDINKNFIKVVENTAPVTFTTGSNVYYIRKSSPNTYTQIMINEGTIALPYQPYEGKIIHEKDLGNYTNIYNVSQLYKHDYNLEAQPSGDTIKVTCWSTKPDKILLEDITRYAFSNVQVYNSSAEYTIQVIKWASSGFRYINDSGNIDSNGYTVTNYYINGEPTTY